jgi:hypothetical protein
MNRPDFTDFFCFSKDWKKRGRTSVRFPFDRGGGGCKDVRSILSGTKECMGYE